MRQERAFPLQLPNRSSTPWRTSLRCKNQELGTASYLLSNCIEELVVRSAREPQALLNLISVKVPAGEVQRSKYPPAKPGALRLGAPQRGPIPNYVRCADLSLLHDFGPFTGCPAKKLNPELIASRCLRNCAFEFVQFAPLSGRLKRLPSDGFAVHGEICVKAEALIGLVGSSQREANPVFCHRV